ncbi:MAG: hypothetical protein DRQ42_00590 [Gammaproteobacteria bacterium]|nr:MAG: hypothetical protein DRQ42_00590 [Gammaproteobacteria bacterium]
MTDMIAELKRLETSVEEAKSQRSVLEGKLESLMDRLSNDFNVTTLEEADKLLEQMKSDLGKLSEKITVKFNDIKEQFEW